jgi:hypothetical protein
MSRGTRTEALNYGNGYDDGVGAERLLHEKVLLLKDAQIALLEAENARLVFTNQQQWEDEKKHAKPRKDSRGHRQVVLGKKVNKQSRPGI